MKNLELRRSHISRWDFYRITQVLVNEYYKHKVSPNEENIETYNIDYISHKVAPTKTKIHLGLKSKYIIYTIKNNIFFNLLKM